MLSLYFYNITGNLHIIEFVGTILTGPEPVFSFIYFKKSNMSLKKITTYLSTFNSLWKKAARALFIFSSKNSIKICKFDLVLTINKHYVLTYIFIRVRQRQDTRVKCYLKISSLLIIYTKISLEFTYYKCVCNNYCFWVRKK